MSSTRSASWSRTSRSNRVVLPAILADWRNPRAQRGEAKHYQTNSPYMSPDPAVGGSFSELVKAVDADMVLAHIPDAVADVQAVMVATGFTGVENMATSSSASAPSA